MSNLCKLSGNSSYGKNLSKPPAKKVKVVSRAKHEQIWADNFQGVGKVEKYANQVLMELENIDTEYQNRAFVGLLVTEIAHLMMYEVADIAREIGTKMYYTDTDSWHMEWDNGALERAYREKFSRELIGKGMGQFAYELKFPGHTDIWSEELIILGKKAYLHVVTGLNSEGVREKYCHYRMKGVNRDAVEAYPDIRELYLDLFKGEERVFDLTYGNGVMFQMKGHTVTRESYKKTIKFLDGKEDEDDY